MKTILIIEDDDIQRNNLAHIILEYNPKINLLQASSAKMAYNILRKEQIDLFYIDVNLPDFNGLELAKKIRLLENYKLTWIVFITSHVEYMLQAFKSIHCYDYITKPYEKQSVIDTLSVLSTNKAKNNQSSMKDREYIVIDSRSVALKLYTDDIIFIEVYLRTCTVHTITGVYELNISLKKVEEMIKDKNLLKCHRAFVINKKYVEKIIKLEPTWEIMFENYDKRASIGRQFRKAILEQIN